MQRALPGRSLVHMARHGALFAGPSRGLHEGSLVRVDNINQLIVNPFVYLPLFYCWTGACVARTAEQTREKARHEYLDSLLATWCIFTPVNLLNFHFVPLRHQTMINVGVSFVYNTSLSLIAAPRRVRGT